MRRDRKPEPDPKIDMTPMIDIVFNLIIFFMIVSDLSNLTVEDLTLSPADQAKEVKVLKEGERVLPINVLADGRVKVRGVSFTVDPHTKATQAPLRDLLRIEAAGTDPDLVAITIRADKDTPFKNVQGVLSACMDAGLTQTRFAADPAGAQGARR